VPDAMGLTKTEQNVTVVVKNGAIFALAKSFHPKCVSAATNVNAPPVTEQQRPIVKGMHVNRIAL
jgi:hypothetical protein